MTPAQNDDTVYTVYILTLSLLFSSLLFSSLLFSSLLFSSLLFSSLFYASTVLTVLMDQKLKQQAQLVAKRLGVPLSVMVKENLRRLVKDPSKEYCQVCDDGEHLVPSKRLIRSLKQADKDRACGDYVTFDNAKDALRFLDDVIAGNVKV